MHASRTDSLDYQVYSIESEVSVWLFGTKRIVTKFHSVFNPDMLVQAEVTMYRNGDLKEKSTTVWMSDHYQVVTDGDLQDPIDRPIKHSIASIYFQLPDASSVYSERFGVEMKSWMQDESFAIEKPGGRLNTYTFGQRYCNLVEVDNALTKLYIVRVK